MTIAKIEVTLCDECCHKEQKSDDNFYCKLHDCVYSCNQDMCEDFEESDNFESDAHTCD